MILLAYLSVIFFPHNFIENMEKSRRRLSNRNVIKKLEDGHSPVAKSKRRKTRRTTLIKNNKIVKFMSKGYCRC